VTYTFAILEVSPACYAEVRAKMLPHQADYGAIKDRSDGECIDMHGLALRMLAPALRPFGELPGLDVRAFNAVHRLGVVTIGDVALLGRRKLWRSPYVGRKTVDCIAAALAEVGLELAP
jgi:DNA-directed RNA polymerase alpha subunit